MITHTHARASSFLSRTLVRCCTQLLTSLQGNTNIILGVRGFIHSKYLKWKMFIAFHSMHYNTFRLRVQIFLLILVHQLTAGKSKILRNRACVHMHSHTHTHTHEYSYVASQFLSVLDRLQNIFQGYIKCILTRRGVWWWTARKWIGGGGGGVDLLNMAVKLWVL